MRPNGKATQKAYTATVSCGAWDAVNGGKNNLQITGDGIYIRRLGSGLQAVESD